VTRSVEFAAGVEGGWCS